LTKFKAPIKELLLNTIVRKVKPLLQDKDSKEQIGVEGVVLRDPITGSQTKIVDKDVFTATNTFNSEVRGNVSGLVRTTDADEPLEMQGGIFGVAKIKIATLLGVPELALSANTRRYIEKLKGSSARATAENLAKSLNMDGVDKLKSEIAKICSSASKQVDDALKEFKTGANKKTLRLKSGKTVSIGPEVMKRALTAFAETRRDISELGSKVQKSKSPADLIIALYGNTIASLFTDAAPQIKAIEKSINMKNESSFSLLKSMNEEADKIKTPAPLPAEEKPVEDSPPAKMIKDRRVVTKRQRKFVRPVKFPRPQAVGEDADAGTISAGGISSYEEPVGDGIISRDGGRSIFGGGGGISPAIEKRKKHKKYSLLKLVNSKADLTNLKMTENWAHVSDMKFATNVTDSSQARNDVEFNQLRNNVDLGDTPTAMGVHQYLDKAQEINDGVDTVTFGMEMDDGSIAKVYVNASQADEFEKALAYMLGNEDDVEQVINMLANKFDIVDVEWPESASQLNQTDAAQGNEYPGEDTVPQDDPNNINLELEPEEDGSEIAGDESSSEVDPEDEDAESGDESGELDNNESDSDEGTVVDDEGNERDDFGQIKKKGKKKKVKDDEGDDSEDADSSENEDEPSDDESSDESDDDETSDDDTSSEEDDDSDEDEKPKKKKEESFGMAGSLISEAERMSEDTSNPSFANVSVQAISDMLIALGFNPSVNQSFIYQAKELIAKNSPGLIAAKQSSVAQKIKTARDALSQALQVSAGAAPTSAIAASTSTPVTQSFTLMGSILAEMEKE
jgi:gas vesicle protein